MQIDCTSVFAYLNLDKKTLSRTILPHGEIIIENGLVYYCRNFYLGYVTKK